MPEFPMEQRRTLQKGAGLGHLGSPSFQEGTQRGQVWSGPAGDQDQRLLMDNRLETHCPTARVRGGERFQEALGAHKNENQHLIYYTVAPTLHSAWTYQAGISWP